MWIIACFVHGLSLNPSLRNVLCFVLVLSQNLVPVNLTTLTFGLSLNLTRVNIAHPALVLRHFLALFWF